MKKIFVLLCVILIFSCVSQPEGQDTEEKGTVTAQSETEQKEPILASVRKVRLLVSNSWFSDGRLDEKTVFTYKEDSKEIIKEETFDAYDKLLEYKEYSYQKGNLILKEFYDSYGEMYSGRKYEYSSEGRMIREYFLDELGEPQTFFDYAYDDSGRRSEWKINSVDDGLLAVTQYVYENGIVKSVNSYDVNGEMVDSFKYKYDSGNTTEFVHYGPESDLINYVEYEYDDSSKLTRELKFMMNNKLSKIINYEYDKDGNVSRETVYDNEGNIQQYFTYEYDFVEVEEWTTDY
jgi:hypothetical protein